MRSLVQRPIALAVLGLAAALSCPTLAQSNASQGARSPEDLAASAVGALERNAATPAAEEPEEVTIRGRRTVTEYRLEMERARDDIVKIFNELNDDSDNEVVCRNERPTGSRMPVRVCRSVAESRAEAAAAKNFLNSLTLSSGEFRTIEGGPSTRSVASADGVGGGFQVTADIGTGEAQGEMVTRGAAARANLEKELLRLMSESRQLYRAVLTYVEAEDAYKAAREAAAE
jgi:hypothetical protein